jgi:hypothetical protein
MVLRRQLRRGKDGHARTGRATRLELQLLEDRRLLNATLPSYGQLPLSFEPNVGQTTAAADFLSHGSGYTLLLSPNQALLGLQTAATQATSSSAAPGAIAINDLSVHLVGGNLAATAIPIDKLPGISNYLIGNDPSKWHSDVPTYGEVEYQNVYPGIEQIYDGNQGRLEYDFVVNPGANPGTIRLSIGGAQTMTLDAAGDLVLHTQGGDVLEQAPVVYQQVNGVRHAVTGRYVLQNDNQFGFAVGAYDPGLPLVIDPVLNYSTYLGGSSASDGAAIAVDAAGEACVTGVTFASDFPTANALQGTWITHLSLAFVAKLNAQGTALIYSTYLGGSEREDGMGIAVDAAGDAYVTGQTASSDFPTVNAFQRTQRDYTGQTFAGNAFVSKLNARGDALIYSTYLGGSGVNSFPEGDVFGDFGSAIAVDASGNAYITGSASSSDFPTVNAFQSRVNTTQDAFVAKLSAQGNALLYSTYLGGSGTFDNGGRGIAVDSRGDAYVTGTTQSSNFPTTANAFQSKPARAFVARFGPSGALTYSTYLGGSGSDSAEGIAVDAAGNAYVTGATGSTDFPTVNPLQAALKGSANAFVTELNPQGSALIYSTYLGGTGSDGGAGIALDAAGDAYVTGETGSTDFPTVNPLQAALKGRANAFVTELNPQGSALVYSTYLGGSGQDNGGSIAVDAGGNVYLTGTTDSTDFPTASPLQPLSRGVSSAFIAKIADYTWSATSVSVDGSGNATLLWDAPSYTTALWFFNSSGAVTAAAVVGPFAPWTATQTSGGSDGLTRILWANIDGGAALWLVGPDGQVENATAYGPVSGGWVPQSIAAGPKGQTYLLWSNPSGQADIWTIGSDLSVTASGPVFSPGAGWSATRIATGPDGMVRLLWTNVSGATALWLLDSSANLVSSIVFGPSAGWTAVDVAVGADNNARLLWTNQDGAAALWLLNGLASAPAATVDGAAPGWTARGFAAAPNGTLRLLWDNLNGAAAVWTLSAADTLQSTSVFAPSASQTLAVPLDAQGTSANSQGVVFAVKADDTLVRIADIGQGLGQVTTVASNVEAISSVKEASGDQIVFAVGLDHSLTRIDATTGAKEAIGAPGTIEHVSAGLDRQGRSDAFVLTTDGSWTEWSSSSGWLAAAIFGPGEVISFKATHLDRAFALTRDHAVLGYDPSFGTFRVTANGFASSIDAVVDRSGHERLYAVTLQASVYAYDPLTGWGQVGGSVSIQSISAGLDSSGNAFLAALTTAGELVRLDANSEELGAAGTLSAAIAGDAGRIFVEGADLRILEFDDIKGWFSLTGPGFAQ